MSGTVCCYSGCKKSYSTDKDNVSFFKFPDDPKRRKKWMQNCGNPELETLSERQLRGKRICSDHFPQKSFMSKSALNDSAVPDVAKVAVATPSKSSAVIAKKEKEPEKVSTPTQQKRGRGRASLKADSQEVEKPESASMEEDDEVPEQPTPSKRRKTNAADTPSETPTTPTTTTTPLRRGTRRKDDVNEETDNEKTSVTPSRPKQSVSTRAGKPASVPEAEQVVKDVTSTPRRRGRGVQPASQPQEEPSQPQQPASSMDTQETQRISPEKETTAGRKRKIEKASVESEKTKPDSNETKDDTSDLPTQIISSPIKSPNILARKSKVAKVSSPTRNVDKTIGSPTKAPVVATEVSAKKAEIQAEKKKDSPTKSPNAEATAEQVKKSLAQIAQSTLLSPAVEKKDATKKTTSPKKGKKVPALVAVSDITPVSSPVAKPQTPKAGASEQNKLASPPMSPKSGTKVDGASPATKVVKVVKKKKEVNSDTVASAIAAVASSAYVQGTQEVTLSTKDSAIIISRKNVGASKPTGSPTTNVVMREVAIKSISEAVSKVVKDSGSSGSSTPKATPKKKKTVTTLGQSKTPSAISIQAGTATKIVTLPPKSSAVTTPVKVVKKIVPKPPLASTTGNQNQVLKDKSTPTKAQIERKSVPHKEILLSSSSRGPKLALAVGGLDVTVSTNDVSDTDSYDEYMFYDREFDDEYEEESEATRVDREFERFYASLKKFLHLTGKWTMGGVQWDPQGKRKVIIISEPEIPPHGRPSLKRCLQFFEDKAVRVFLDGMDMTDAFGMTCYAEKEDVASLVSKVASATSCCGVPEMVKDDLVNFPQTKKRNTSYFDADCPGVIPNDAYDPTCPPCKNLQTLVLESREAEKQRLLERRIRSEEKQFNHPFGKTLYSFFNDLVDETDPSKPKKKRNKETFFRKFLHDTRYKMNGDTTRTERVYIEKPISVDSVSASFQDIVSKLGFNMPNAKRPGKPPKPVCIPKPAIPMGIQRARMAANQSALRKMPMSLDSIFPTVSAAHSNFTLDDGQEYELIGEVEPASATDFVEMKPNTSPFEIIEVDGETLAKITSSKNQVVMLPDAHSNFVTRIDASDPNLSQILKAINTSHGFKA